MIGVNDLDDAVVLLNSNSNSTEKEIKSKQVVKTKLDEKLENDYIGLDEKMTDIKKLNELVNSIKEKQNLINKLNQANNEFFKINEKGEDLKVDITLATLIYDSLFPYVEKIEKSYSDLCKYDDCYQKDIMLSSDIKNKEKDYKFYSDIIEGGLSDIIKKLEDNSNIYIKMNDLNLKITSTQSNLTNTKDKITELENLIVSTNTNLNAIIEEIKDKNLSCESCNTFGGMEL